MKITVTVKPRAKKEAVSKVSEGEYQVSVKAPAQQGKANEAVVKALAEYFKVQKSRVQILRGASGRKKIIEVMPKL